MPIPGVKTLEDPSARLLYSIDQGEPPAALRSRFARTPEMVAQPTTIDELKAVLAHARQHRLAVVPRGSASSGFGAVISTRAGIVLDLSWMRDIVAFDPQAGTVTVQTGVRWSDLNAALEPKGLGLRSYPSNSFSTVGGWVATGGLGIGSLKYGRLMDSVEKLRVVLPGGEEKAYVRTDPEFELFFGSDGQLGVVAEIVLRVRATPPYRRPAAFTFPDERAAIEFLRRAYDAGVTPFYGNLWNAARMREKNHLMHRNDFPAKTTLLLYVESREEEAKLQGLKAPEALPLWQAMLCWEDRFFPIRAKKLGPGLLAAELVFPLDRVAAYIEAAQSLGHGRGFEVVVEAQLVARDQAVVIASFLYDSRDGGESLTAGAIAMRLAVLGLKMGGAPYNLGLWYSPFAEDKFGARLDALRAFKAKVDPARLFNPGKSLDRIGWYVAFLKLFKAVPFLPPWYRKKKDRHEEVKEYTWQNSWDVCSKCAACVAHCPAVLAVGDERVSARGKMFLLSHLDQIGPEEAQMVFLCMHCKYCTEVCQSEIRLEDCFFDLERAVGEKYGRPDAKIREFLDRVAAQGLMERVPMSRAEPPWETKKLEYDDVKGQVSHLG